MKSKLFSNSLFCALTILVATASAHNPLTKGQAQPMPSTANKVEAGDCRIPVSQIDLNINNVRARILNAGDMWWDFSNARYEVPKGDGTGTPINAIFAGAIWVSGIQDGNLKIEYSEGRNKSRIMIEKNRN